MQRLISVLCALTLLFAGAAGSIDAKQKGLRKLTILYFNDIHGHLEPWKADPKDEKTIGGVARMATLVEQIRRENRAKGASTIFLLAGDVLQGTPMSSIFQGEPDIQSFNLMRLDAMVFGNHEFDFGQANLKKIVQQSRFPVLGANIFHEDGRPYAQATTVLTPAPGLRIGVFGLTTQETPTTTFPTNVSGLTFDDPTQTARHIVPILDAQCDIVVALTHIGVPEDQRLAREVPGIDVVIGGHTQIPLPTPERVGDTVICQAQDNCRYLGRLDLTIDANNKVTVTRGELIPIGEGIVENRMIATLVGSYGSKLKNRLSVVIGKARVKLDGEREDVRGNETNLGNFITDLMREAAHTDVALINAGGIRASINAGDVTYGDVINAFPFNNTIVAGKFRGKTLREALDRSASLNPEDLPGAFLQVSGLTYVIDNGKATNVRIAGEPLDDERVYTIAMPNFMLAGGDGYGMFGPGSLSHVDTGIVLNGIVVKYFESSGAVDAKVEGRITRRSASSGRASGLPRAA